jgi:predicted CXXCH cytochrome family protein
MSMLHAAPDSVQGNFDNAEILFDGEISRFFQRGEAYWVNIKGPDGNFQDYQIKYTFGYTPLQQYMVEFEDGRVQLIPFAWDSRSKEEGGQRWFHLYPEFTDKRDDFFWTGVGQNWNYMCADCHSTNLNKNYDVKTDSYNTRFSEINVACEACHGPASNHLDWLDGTQPDLTNKGFNRTLSKAVDQWLQQDGKTTLSPKEVHDTQQTLVCAQCHSRHLQISDQDYVSSGAFGDRYALSLINAQRYYPDGQVYDEVFVYGSFLQSKMHRNGVTCTNCHNPHSGELNLPQESLCLQCHQAETYASETHHHHPSGSTGDSTGAQCVNCHMPETTFMQVDARRDHGWHIPRSDFAKTLGTPDACLGCHKDKDSHWSDEQINRWYPQSAIRQEKHFAPVFAAIDAGNGRALGALSHIAQNQENAPIIRASAMERMASFADGNSLIAIARGARDGSEFVRLGAVRGAGSLQVRERWRILSPLLSDKVLAVRMEAANALAAIWTQLAPEQQKQLRPALDEYLQAQTFNHDRAFSHNNQGMIYAYLGESEKAEQAFKAGIKVEPTAPQVYLNLAELYRSRGELEERVMAVLQQGVTAVSSSASAPLYYQLGLSSVRMAETNKAVPHFEQAINVEPNNPRYYYVLGLALEKTDVTKAQQALRQAYQVGGDPNHLYALCDMQVRYESPEAGQCIAELSPMAPPAVINRLRGQLRLKP